MLTIEPPPRSIMIGTVCLHSSMGPRRFTAITPSHSSTGMVTTSRPRLIADTSAALLSRMSTPPNVSTVNRTSRRTLSSSDISAT